MKYKSKWLVLIALLLAATMLFAACGGSAETPADSNGTGNGNTTENGGNGSGNSSGDSTGENSGNSSGDNGGSASGNNGGESTPTSEGINIDGDGLVNGDHFSGEALLVPATAPDGTPVTAIDIMAFSGNSKLKKVILPDSVKTIKYQAFYNCDALAEINLENVSVIDACAFSGCISLKTVTLGSGLRRIATDTFEYCEGLESIVIPEGVGDIGEFAFYNCTALASVTLPASLDVIDEDAFKNTALSEINYGGTMDGWESIGKGTLLDNCPNLTVHCADGATYHYVNGTCID